MDYEKIPGEWKNFLSAVFLILVLLLIFFVNNIYDGFLFVMLLLFCWLFFIFMDNQAKREELNDIIRLRKNKTKYLFKEFPREFP